MNYRNTEMKLDQIVQYFNEEKINLSPAFQRGHVWSLSTRRKLIANIVQGRPIPAIFLYKEASGSRYSYNILDGKQRLESLILFVGSNRPDMSVKNWAKYFFPPKMKEAANFSVVLPTGKKTFASLEDAVVREFREYAIPTVEISLTDDSHLDEIISLFVDINKEGVAVGRFDIVKAMGANNKLLRSVFNLIAIKQDRAQDIHYKVKKNDITFVLKTLDIVAKVADGKAQVDRMWEQLLEIVLFFQTRRHRKPVDILKSFISRHGAEQERFPPLKADEARKLRAAFSHLRAAYKVSPALRQSGFALDRPMFYTLITSLLSTDLMTRFTQSELISKLLNFEAQMVNLQSSKSKKIKAKLDEFFDLVSDRTTDSPRRELRQKLFVELLSEM